MRSLNSVNEPESQPMTNRGGVQVKAGSAQHARRRPVQPIAPESVPDEERLLPVIAGARARGMADALETMGVAAVMLDWAGMALHASSHVTRFVGTAAGRGLSLVSATLISANPATNRALQTAIAEIISGDSHGSRRIVDPEARVVLTIKPIRDAENDRYQLLRALVVLETVD